MNIFAFLFIFFLSGNSCTVIRQLKIYLLGSKKFSNISESFFILLLPSFCFSINNVLYNKKRFTLQKKMYSIKISFFILDIKKRNFDIYLVHLFLLGDRIVLSWLFHILGVKIFTCRLCPNQFMWLSLIRNFLYSKN